MRPFLGLPALALLVVAPCAAQDAPPPGVDLPAPLRTPGGTELRFGVPDGETPAPPVPGVYPEMIQRDEEPPALGSSASRRMEGVNAVIEAPTWQAADAVARASLDETDAETPRYILEQSAGVALLQRADFLPGPPASASSPAEAAVAGWWLDTLNRDRYAHLPDLHRLIEAVRGTWPETRVREAAQRALASDREWQIRKGTLAQAVAFAALVRDEDPPVVPEPPRPFFLLSEEAHEAARQALAELAR